MSQDLKPWVCRADKDHIMGLVMRDGSGIRKLLLYRNAITLGEAMDGTEIDVFAIVEGYVANVKCDLCGSARTWIPGPEAVRKMIREYKK